jgi:hypothetical protein
MNLTLAETQQIHFATVRAAEPSPSLLAAIKSTEDDLDGWTHTLATLREINAGMPFAHPIAEQ